MEKPLKIIHIEDNTSDAWLIERALKKSGLAFTVKVVDSKQDFINALDHFQPDLILSDHSLPQFDSMEALKIYKEKGGVIPFILITGSVSEEFAILSIKEGADDYILKNNLIRLPAAIDQALKARQTILERETASRELEITNKELNTFIYKAAHELRGPLCSIMGLTNIAGMESEKQTMSDYIEKISESTRKLDAVLLSLIHVMTIKDATPVVREIDFKKLVRDILKQPAIQSNSGGIDFNLKIGNTPGFFSDENILNSIMLHIIENAVRYRNTVKPGSFVNISVKSTLTGIQIEIEDNGIGIAEEMHEQIFEMYFRGNQYSKGSGLGLYIVKNGVKKLGGSIEVKSELMKGTIFTITLPSNLILM
ncbi:MAG TPA: hybrid sensor histidine kinase/response regulator [Bacteroidia bacterium]|nr:hybrid sensor histidine kinase/response regulator [Bacteroidia bacterium]